MAGRHTWTALVAPLNHAAPDGRTLTGDQWTLSELARLSTLDGQIVGGVTDLEVTDTTLRCAGYVYGEWDELAAKMAAGKLRPQLDINGGGMQVKLVDGEPRWTFHNGRITAITLGDTPAFPEARFDHVVPAGPHQPAT